MNYYEELGLKYVDENNPSSKEIRKAYMEMIKKFHPDKQTDEAMRLVFEEKVKAVNNAYSILKDKNKKMEYDLFRRENVRDYSKNSTTGSNYGNANSNSQNSNSDNKGNDYNYSGKRTNTGQSSSKSNENSNTSSNGEGNSGNSKKENYRRCFAQNIFKFQKRKYVFISIIIVVIVLGVMSKSYIGIKTKSKEVFPYGIKQEDYLENDTRWVGTYNGGESLYNVIMEVGKYGAKLIVGPTKESFKDDLRVFSIKLKSSEYNKAEDFFTMEILKDENIDVNNINGDMIRGTVDGDEIIGDIVNLENENYYNQGKLKLKKEESYEINDIKNTLWIGTYYHHDEDIHYNASLEISDNKAKYTFAPTSEKGDRLHGVYEVEFDEFDSNTSFFNAKCIDKSDEAFNTFNLNGMILGNSIIGDFSNKKNNVTYGNLSFDKVENREEVENSFKIGTKWSGTFNASSKDKPRTFELDINENETTAIIGPAENEVLGIPEGRYTIINPQVNSFFDTIYLVLVTPDEGLVKFTCKKEGNTITGVTPNIGFGYVRSFEITLQE